MATEHWFHTPLLIKESSGEQLTAIQSQISEVYKTLNVPENVGDDTVKTTYDFSGNNDIVTYKLTHLHDFLIEGVNEYCDSVGYNGPLLKLDTSWFNVSGRGGYHSDHVHPNCRISGVYYYQTNGNDGNIRFRDPNPYSVFGNWPFDGIERTFVSYAPKVGRVVMFPSWLSHRVAVNQTDDTRISIAFNFI